MAIDFPANPTNGQVYANYIYDSSITAWRNVNTDTGIGTLNAMGLKNVVPTSVNVGGGSATVNANGTLSFSGVTYIALFGVFTSTYTNYRYSINVSSTLQADINFKMVSGTTVSTASNTYSAGTFPTNTGTNNILNGFTNLTYGLITSSNGSAVGPVSAYGDIGQPAQAAITTLTAQSMGWDVSGGVYRAFNINSAVSNLTAFDGIYIYPSSGGTITGTINIYGYTK